MSIIHLMPDFVTLRETNPDFDDLCEARDAVLRAIEMHQLSEEALQEKLNEWDHKIKIKFVELNQ